MYRTAMAIDLKNTVGGEKNGQGGLTRQETDCRRTNVADESLDRAQCISSPSEEWKSPRVLTSTDMRMAQRPRRP